jgi:endonuclease YncB( thermonuclease family)
MKKIYLVALGTASSICCALLPLQVQAETFDAKVVAVIDGDTLSVLHNGGKERVILYGIDCPESTQEFGPEAQKYTDESCYGKMVTIETKGTDPRGRTIAVVTLPDGNSLNKQLLEQGLAWWSDKFAPGETRFQVLQASARTKKIGLWSGSNPIPPWLFRNGDKGVQGTIMTK